MDDQEIGRLLPFRRRRGQREEKRKEGDQEESCAPRLLDRPRGSPPLSSHVSRLPHPFKLEWLREDLG